MKPFVHQPAVHHVATVGNETRRLLRQVLARDPETRAEGAPILLRQRMSCVGGEYWPLAGIDLMVSGVDGDKVHLISLAGLGDAAGALALALDDERMLAASLGQVAVAERLGYDHFMMEEVVIDILHFPSALAISWSMSSKRIKKLIKNQPQGQPPAMRSNNPAGALGTIVLDPASSNHEKLKAQADLEDARARLARWIALQARDLSVSIGDPLVCVEE